MREILIDNGPVRYSDIKSPGYYAFVPLAITAGDECKEYH